MYTSSNFTQLHNQVQFCYNLIVIWTQFKSNLKNNRRKERKYNDVNLKISTFYEPSKPEIVLISRVRFAKIYSNEQTRASK